MMRLLVRSHLSSTFAVDISEGDCVSDLKNRVYDISNVDPSSQRLRFGSAELVDDVSLGEYGLEDGHTVDLNVGLLGGGKKRKKKAYTTPKKIKHKRKKVKLATLKFYRVDPNGKITRLRKECPSASCGPGVFMASHFDRQYCGKCWNTFMHANK